MALLPSRVFCLSLPRGVLDVRSRLCLAVIALMFLVPSSPMRIEVRPLISHYGQPIRVRCYVTPDPENRWVDIGIQGFTIGRQQLDKDDVVAERTFREPPCGEQIGFCELTQTGNRVTKIVQPFEVSCVQ